VRAKETSSFLCPLGEKISRIDRRFAAYARLKNKKSAGEGYDTTTAKTTATTKQVKNCSPFKKKRNRKTNDT
jgi:hypothetical protein